MHLASLRAYRLGPSMARCLAVASPRERGRRLARPSTEALRCTDEGAEAASQVSAHYRAGDVLALAADTPSCDGAPRFGLYWEGFQESSPVQVKLRVTAVDTGCAVETKSQVFDLAALRAAYTSAYGGEHGELTLRLHDDTVSYVFGARPPRPAPARKTISDATALPALWRSARSPGVPGDGRPRGIGCRPDFVGRPVPSPVVEYEDRRLVRQ
jgi:hypothetical protein